MMKVAVVGGGQIARKVYLPTLAAMDDVELAVLVEPDERRREAIARKYRFEAAVASVDELAEGQVDAAFVLTPHEHRRGPLKGLFERGIDVFSEKPMAADLPEAEQFVELAEASGRIFMVGFNRRFMPAYLKAKEFIGDRPVWVCRAWKHAARLWSHSLHVLDMLRFFCGEPVRIQAEGNLNDAGRETAVGAVIRFDSGAIGLFETAGHYGRRQEELVAHGPVYTVEVLAPYEVVCAEEDTGTSEVFRPGSNEWYTESNRLYGFVDEIRHFLDAVRDRTTPLNTAAEALKSHRLAHDLLEAIRAS